MKKDGLTLICFGLAIIAKAQTPKEIIARVQQAQQNIHSASYHVNRQDTLVTNDVRILSGDVAVEGLRFRVHQDGKENVRIFDGQLGYDLYPQTHQYQRYITLPGGFSYNDGTQLILKDLIKLDTTKAIRIVLQSKRNSYDLTFNYADLTEYDLTQRRKIVTIDKTTFLPIAVREHQLSLGRVQDLYYQVKELKLNAPLEIDLSGYTLQMPKPSASAAITPAFATAFPFTLKSFDGPSVSLESAKGKIVLLDFWEVWCGPCIESLPKVEALYKNFHSQGLEIYGITHDSAQIAPARKLAQKYKLSFPTLIGTSKTKTLYGISSLPTYMLIDAEGRTVMTTTGYSAELKARIKELLTK